jgi:hypothetical protein
MRIVGPPGRRTVGVITCVLWIGLVLSLSAQTHQQGDPTIDTVIVVSHNVFDPPGGTPHFVATLGNALHVTTHPGVIRRLLLVGVRSTLDSARLVESARALRELGVFRTVALDTFHIDDRLALKVETADGWSTSPQLNFSSTAGSTTWSAAMVERNFLGTATFVSVAYGKNPDRSSFDVQFASPGLLISHAPLQVIYSDLSDGRLGVWSYGVPFYRADARWSLVTWGAAASHRVLDFLDGLVSDSTERRTLQFGLQGGVALHATTTSYTRLWVGAAWRREDFAPETSATFAYSQFGTIGAGIEAARVRYGVFEHVNGFGRHEDIDLSSLVAVGLWAAPRAWGYPGPRAGVGPTVRAQLGTLWPSGLARLQVGAQGVIRAAGVDSGTAYAIFDLASTGLKRQAVVLHVEGRALRNPSPGTALDPWVTHNGPRGFAAHAFTGTRLFYAMLENRVLVTDELWGVLGLGAAPYLEYGGAWYAGVERARLGGDAGVALRLGSPRSTLGDVAELDIAWRWGAGFPRGKPWALTFRRSFTLK